eukprot:600254-Prymnesium_polylepis.2
MQARQRVLPDGTVEDYEKPRVSTDESDSASDDSPNAGIPADETTLGLPTAVDFAGGLATVGVAFGGISRAGAYAVDLESAFRFV